MNTRVNDPRPNDRRVDDLRLDDLRDPRLIALPGDDRSLSPHTGWTRAHWERVADVILDGAARHASPAQSLIRYPGEPGGLGRDVDHLEGFTRTFMLAAFRIAGPEPAPTPS